MGSTGLAAGNTIEEALTQGLSEICEHYVHYQMYYEERTFSYLDLDMIQLPQYISNFFISLKEKKYTYYVYDFSYLYQIPVLGLLIVDPIKHVSYMNMAAAPNFIIALERCCTEIYQGHTYLGDNLK
jgi:ribosomal protein S12 methylthiotransferase accessory factor